MQQEWENNVNLLSLEFLPLQSTSKMLLSPSSCISGMVMKKPPSNSTREGVWLLILKTELGWAVEGSSGAQEELYQIPCQVMSSVLS